MKPFPFLCVPLLLVCVLALGCKSGSEQPKEKSYEIKGTVVAVHAEKPSVELDHQDVPGLMPAMAMDFDVANPKVLDGLNCQQ